MQGLLQTLRAKADVVFLHLWRQQMRHRGPKQKLVSVLPLQDLPAEAFEPPRWAHNNFFRTWNVKRKVNNALNLLCFLRNAFANILIQNFSMSLSAVRKNRLSGGRNNSDQYDKIDVSLQVFFSKLEALLDLNCRSFYLQFHPTDPTQPELETMQ